MSTLQTANVTVTATTMSVAIQSPAENAIVSTSMPVTASSTGANITAMQVYVDGTLADSVPSAQISTTVPVSAGPHQVAVKAWNSSGSSVLQTVSVVAVAPTTGITIQSHAPNATVASPLQVIATGYDTLPITAAVKIWDSARKAYLSTETIKVQ